MSDIVNALYGHTATGWPALRSCVYSTSDILVQLCWISHPHQRGGWDHLLEGIEEGASDDSRTDHLFPTRHQGRPNLLVNSLEPPKLLQHGDCGRRHNCCFFSHHSLAPEFLTPSVYGGREKLSAWFSTKILCSCSYLASWLNKTLHSPQQIGVTISHVQWPIQQLDTHAYSV